MKWLALAVSLGAAASLMATTSCDDDGEGGGGGGVVVGETGDPCTDDSQCDPEGLCLNDKSFEALTEGNSTANIPGGYCSRLLCTVGDTTGQCGPNGFCFDLEAYVETSFSACFKTCDSEADCRDGYVCTDASNATDYPPLPHKACLPPDLLCLLDIPQPECPDVGQGGGGSGGAPGGSGGSGGSGG